MKAVDAASQDQVLDSLNSRLLLRGPHGAELTEEQTKSLQKFIGMEAYNRLEGFDIMLEAAADGAVPPPMGLAD
jgi:hypothetical protein